MTAVGTAARRTWYWLNSASVTSVATPSTTAAYPRSQLEPSATPAAPHASASAAPAVTPDSIAVLWCSPQTATSVRPAASAASAVLMRRTDGSAAALRTSQEQMTHAPPAIATSNDQSVKWNPRTV